MTNVTYITEGISSIRDLAITYKRSGISARMTASLEEIEKDRKNRNDKESANAAAEAIKQIKDRKE